MKINKILAILIILNSILTKAQTRVELRDLTFFVPSQFNHFTEQDRKLKLDFYNETGKIFTDSIDLEKFPKIQYQYYENPESGLKSANEVLKSLNEIMTKDINADSLLINEDKNYSFAKYSIMGKSLFEIKSLGKKGWLNIQYFDLPANDEKSLKSIKTIIESIKHFEVYESDYEKQMKESGKISKWVFIFLGITLIGIFGRIFRKKNVV